MDIGQWITHLCGDINRFLWLWVGLTLLIITGAWMTLRTGFFQIRYARHWLGQTLGHLSKRADRRQGGISPFQALCTTLAATVGVGNIAGVAVAIATGGPGAVFWMWVAALLGMMTGYAESVLGIYYRRRGADGWLGGAMYYIRDGLGGKIGRVSAATFALCMTLASFGIGNMAQVSAITSHLESAFPLPLSTWNGTSLYALAVSGILTAVVGVILKGGSARAASVAEKIVPHMIVLFLLGSLTVILINRQRIGAAFGAIFRYAFTPSALWGAGSGVTLRQVITCGFRRGTFSNEAGMGSSVAVHATTDVSEPVEQGMWSILQVFVDTVVMCTVTALVVLTGGVMDLSNGRMLTDAPATALVSKAFGGTLGHFGEGFVAVAVAVFAFTTILGWSQFGAKAAAYLGDTPRRLYAPLFLLAIPAGAVMGGTAVLDLCDVFNGLMMVTNLPTLLLLSGTVKAITDNYIDRRIHHKAVVPMLSHYPRIQHQMARQSHS